MMMMISMIPAGRRSTNEQLLEPQPAGHAQSAHAAAAAPLRRRSAAAAAAQRSVPSFTRFHFKLTPFLCFELNIVLIFLHSHPIGIFSSFTLLFDYI